MSLPITDLVLELLHCSNAGCLLFRFSVGAESHVSEQSVSCASWDLTSLLGVMEAKIQEFTFMHKTLSVLGFYCHFSSIFCSFWGKNEVGQVEIPSYNELMIIRAEQLPGKKEVLERFQSISASSFSAGWFQSLLHHAVLLDNCYCSIYCCPDLSSSPSLVVRRSWSSRMPWLQSKPLDALAWPLGTLKDSLGYRGQDWGILWRAAICGAVPPEQCWDSAQQLVCNFFIFLDSCFILQGLWRLQLGTGNLLAQALLHGLDKIQEGSTCRPPLIYQYLLYQKRNKWCKVPVKTVNKVQDCNVLMK